LKTAVERVSATHVKLTVEATPEDLRPSIDHAYEHVAQQVNIPGFRKGKVPAPVLDQRVGRPYILAHAIQDGVNDLYGKALEAEKLRPLMQPDTDIVSSPDENTFEGNLVINFELEVRPEFKLPEYKGLKVKVDSIKVAKMDVESELDALRARFGTLVTADRPAKSGDFTTIDLQASIDGNQIDAATDISYQIGSGQLLDGIDEALETLTAGETTTFKSTLVGGEFAGQQAEVNVTLQAVKDRELPAADDEFAQLASEFDTIAELRTDIEKRLEVGLGRRQGVQARDLLLKQLIEAAKIPVSEKLVEFEVNSHLEGEGRLEDTEHRAEVTEQSTNTFVQQMLLDAIVEAEQVKVEDQELIEHLVRVSRDYGMGPNEFVKQVSENGQLPLFVADLSRRKAVDVIFDAAEVTDSKGNPIAREEP
jgi:trigger factor